MHGGDDEEEHKGGQRKTSGRTADGSEIRIGLLTGTYLQGLSATLTRTPLRAMIHNAKTESCTSTTSLYII